MHNEKMAAKFMKILQYIVMIFYDIQWFIL